MPAFWLILCAFILLPCACFLLLAVSPRLFDQGSQWFTLSYLRQSLTGSTAVAIVNSLWVSSAAAAIGLVVGFPVAWLAALSFIALVTFAVTWMAVVFGIALAQELIDRYIDKVRV